VKRVLVLIGLVLLASCGKDSPSAPSTPQLAGVWRGSIQNTTPGGQPNGTVVFTIAQNGSTLSGNWSTTYADASLNNSGTMSGTIANAVSVAFTLEPSVPIYCPYNATASVTGRSMSGTYVAFNCSVPVSGTFSASKQ
jgi:hypothetical protein